MRFAQACHVLCLSQHHGNAGSLKWPMPLASSKEGWSVGLRRLDAPRQDRACVTMRLAVEEACEKSVDALHGGLLTRCSRKNSDTAQAMDARSSLTSLLQDLLPSTAPFLTLYCGIERCTVKEAALTQH